DPATGGDGRDGGAQRRRDQARGRPRGGDRRVRGRRRRLRFGRGRLRARESHGRTPRRDRATAALSPAVRRGELEQGRRVPPVRRDGRRGRLTEIGRVGGGPGP